MTLAELLQYLDRHTGYGTSDGNLEQTLRKSAGEMHRDPLIGEILGALARHCRSAGADCPIDRVQAVSALAPLRLRHMKDDAPPDALRAVERIILTIDGAFNEEALRGR